MRIIHRKGERIVVELDDVATAMLREFMAKGHPCLLDAAGRDPRDVVSAAVVFMLDDADDGTSSQERLVEAHDRRLNLEAENT